jgi:hypothetical protein
VDRMTQLSPRGTGGSADITHDGASSVHGVRGARGHRGSPVVAREDKGDVARLVTDSSEHERRQ